MQKEMQDVLAASIKSQDDRFADLHNRIQYLQHSVNEVYQLLDKYHQQDQDRFNSLMDRVVSTNDQTSAMLRNVEKIERMTMEVQRTLESRDFKDMLEQVHRAIEDSHTALSKHMPIAMAHSKSTPTSEQDDLH
jgi:lectin, mannose-binding 1